MTTPDVSTVTLVESIMNDVHQARWERLPPMALRPETEVVQAQGTSWRLLVVRWKQGSEFHFEAVATSKIQNTPTVVRLPATDAAAAWRRFDSQQN